MKYHLIRAERSLVDNEYNVDDLTYTITQSPQHWLLNGRKTVYEFAGKNHTVYVMDTWDEIDRKICNQIAVNFVTGNYQIYSLSTGEWSKGKPQ